MPYQGFFSSRGSQPILPLPVSTLDQHVSYPSLQIDRSTILPPMRWGRDGKEPIILPPIGTIANLPPFVSGCQRLQTEDQNRLSLPIIRKISLLPHGQSGPQRGDEVWRKDKHAAAFHSRRDISPPPDLLSDHTSSDDSSRSVSPASSEDFGPRWYGAGVHRHPRFQSRKHLPYTSFTDSISVEPRYEAFYRDDELRTRSPSPPPPPPSPYLGAHSRKFAPPTLGNLHPAHWGTIAPSALHEPIPVRPLAPSHGQQHITLHEQPISLTARRGQHKPPKRTTKVTNPPAHSVEPTLTRPHAPRPTTGSGGDNDKSEGVVNPELTPEELREAEAEEALQRQYDVIEETWTNYVDIIGFDAKGQPVLQCLHKSKTDDGKIMQCTYGKRPKMLVHRHVTAVHLGIQRYRCPYCFKRSAQATNLVIHIRKHTGESPLVCPYKGCEQREKDPARMHRHKCEKHGYVPKFTDRKLGPSENCIGHVKDFNMPVETMLDPKTVLTASASAPSSSYTSAPSAVRTLAAAAPPPPPTQPLQPLPEVWNRDSMKENDRPAPQAEKGQTRGKGGARARRRKSSIWDPETICPTTNQGGATMCF